MQKIHRNISQRNKKSVSMATLVARCCRKTNQLKSVQGFGMQRYKKKQEALSYCPQKKKKKKKRRKKQHPHLPNLFDETKCDAGPIGDPS